LKGLLPTKRVGSGPINSQRTGQVCCIQVHISDPIPDPEIEGEYYPVVSCLIPDPETGLKNLSYRHGKRLRMGGLEEIPQNPDVTMNMACIATEVLSERHVNKVDEIG
jgi:hypothetical protein